MKRHISTVACAAAILFSSASIDAILTPASAQMDVSFDTFHDQLAPYGDWVYSDRWGEVWIPNAVPDNFQPYGTDGYWADTDEYGWLWVSNYEWGDIPFHYGRWVNDPDDGWLWIPGYVWSPAWVVWRSNGQYIGWMPTPPDREFLGYGPSVGISIGGGLGISVNFNDTGGYYGYSQWYGPGYNQDSFAANWVFVDSGHMADRDFQRYQAPRGNYTSIISNTTNITNYTVVNNYIVNKSVDPRVVEKASGHPIVAVHVAQVIKKPQLITRADQGSQVQTRMRTQMPRGSGAANSAPKPSPQVVQSLSTKVTPRAGHPAAHLYTRDTVTTAPLPAKPGGAVPNTVGAPGNKTKGGPATPPAGAPRTETPKGPAAGTGATEPENSRRRGNQNLPGNTTPQNQPGGPNRPNDRGATPPPTSAPQTTNPNGTTEPQDFRRRNNPNAPANTTPETRTGGPNAPAGPGAAPPSPRKVRTTNPNGVEPNGQTPPENSRRRDNANGPGNAAPQNQTGGPNAPARTVPPKRVPETANPNVTPPKTEEKEKKNKPDDDQKPQ